MALQPLICPPASKAPPSGTNTSGTSVVLVSYTRNGYSPVNSSQLQSWVPPGVQTPNPSPAGTSPIGGSWPAMAQIPGGSPVPGPMSLGWTPQPEATATAITIAIL